MSPYFTAPRLPACKALQLFKISCAIPLAASYMKNKQDLNHPTYLGNLMAAYELTVSVKTQYLEQQSDPEQSSFVFAYAITIKNTGQVAAQLISRHWIITDSNNQIEEVRGLGVVGHQPFLKPGEQFEYTSGATLKTPHGSMCGEYFCVAEDGAQFVAKIPEFILSLPRTLH
jgi:ApaG protein